MKLRVTAGIVIASFGVSLAMSVSAQSLEVRLNGDHLRIAAPQFQFLTGKPLQRLKDGASVGFLGQLTVSTDGNATVQARAVARFAMSYDIWEERFSVTQLDKTRHSASHLSSQAAQSWCLDNLKIDLSTVPPDKPFWIRLDFRAEDPHDQPAVVGEPGINLTRLIEVFSRPARSQQPHWLLEAGPLRLADLKAKSG